MCQRVRPTLTNPAEVCPTRHLLHVAKRIAHNRAAPDGQQTPEAQNAHVTQFPRSLPLATWSCRTRRRRGGPFRFPPELSVAAVFLFTTPRPPEPSLVLPRAMPPT